MEIHQDNLRLQKLIYFNDDFDVNHIYDSLNIEDKKYLAFQSFNDFINPIINTFNAIRNYLNRTESEEDEEYDDDEGGKEMDIYDHILYHIDYYISIKDKICSEELNKRDSDIQLLLDKINILESKLHIKSSCIDGTPDMRLRQNKGKQKYQNIIGNTHTSYMKHKNCKLCQMSICGICIKHGG